MGIFPVFYLFTTFAIVPNIAPLFGRVALPMFTRNHVRPVNMLTCVFNRNYVRPALKQAVENVAAKMSEKYDDCEIRYLDANMPFINGFPLIPHLSHSDGRKLDIAFFYIEKNTQMPTNQKPSWSGYGVFAGPRKGEFDRIAKCIGDGFWQYDYPKYMAFINRENDFELDETRTAEMTTYFNQENAIERMFIEPHLKSRLHLQNLQKIGLHGCKAVRHDDHLHIQIVKN